MNVFEFAKVMGRHIHKRWKKEGFAVERFPDISLRALLAFLPSCHINLDTALSGITAPGIVLPYQRMVSPPCRGQSTLTLYNDMNDLFYIEMQCWTGGDEDIQDDPFCGAFTVLHGACRHETLAFNRSGGTDDLQTGTLKHLQCEELLSGNARTTGCAGDHIHRIRYLSRPTLTLTVGKKGERVQGRVYRPGGLALTSSLFPVEAKYLEWLDELLILHKEAAAVDFIHAMAANLTRPCALFKAAEQYLNMTWRYDRMDALIGLVDAHFGPGFAPTLREVFTLKMMEGR